MKFSLKKALIASLLALTALASNAQTVLVGSTVVQSGVDSNSAGTAEALIFTATASGTSNTIHLYLDSANTATRVSVGIYADVSGRPGTLLGTSIITAPIAGAWNTVSTNISITSGQKYWIALLAPVGYGSVYFRDLSSGGGDTVSSSQTNLTSMPSTWTTGTHYANSPASVYLTANTAPVNTVYVRSGATGRNDGTDWTNAYTNLPASLVRGSTYYLAGGTYGSHTFADPVSGTSVINVRKAISTDHGTNTGWLAAYGTSQAQFNGLSFNTSYYTFDGVTGGGPGAWETNLGFKVQDTYHTIDFPATVSNISIKHTDIQGGGRDAANETDLLYLLYGFSNISVSNCFLHDTSTTMILSRGGSGFLIENSKFARNGVLEHREAWSGADEDNVIVRNNLFEDVMGTGVIALVNGAGDATNWDIYGNVFYWTGKYLDGEINTGIIVNRYDPVGGQVFIRAVNWHIYNNVIANISGTSLTAAFDVEGPLGTYVVENNIWYNNTPRTGSDGTLVDYNWFFANGTNNTTGTHDIVGTASPFVDVQPWVTGNWKLKAALPGISVGAPYNVDMNGVIRAHDGVWDRGALEY